MTCARPQGERGAALLAAVLLLLILSILGSVSLSLGIQEIQGVGAAEADAAARHLAEAGIDTVIQWFHDPAARASADRVGLLLAKRYDHPDTGPSYFDGNGASQFSGTADRPDLLFDATRPEDDRLLNDPGSGLFHSLTPMGRIVKLKVYGPQQPGLLCTVESTAAVGGVTRTVSVGLGVLAIPALRAAVQVGGQESPGTAEALLPVWVHWGDVGVAGTARLGPREALPVKGSLAPVTGRSYFDMDRLEDRWLDVWVGGAALLTPTPGRGAEPLPANVYPYQDPVPGLWLDRWSYETLKRYALRFGSYYVARQDGLLYRNGAIQPGMGLTADDVFASAGPGDHRGLVFVDTVDAQPPHGDNLATVTLEADYAEGLFLIQGHLRLKPKGPGHPLSVLSPPPEERSDPASRMPVQLSGVHLRGVLSVAGTLTVEGHPRLYGAVVAGQRIVPATGPGDRLEVWYDGDLRSGLFRGVPLVYVAPGSWRDDF
ncbi:hypothetical protein [Nitrospira sp. Kam-Ns4a]